MNNYAKLRTVLDEIGVPYEAGLRFEGHSPEAVGYILAIANTEDEEKDWHQPLSAFLYFNKEGIYQDTKIGYIN